MKDSVGQVLFLVSCPKGQVEKYVNVEASLYKCLLDFILISSFLINDHFSQLRLIETLFRDPSDVTLPKFSK
jgi:hypothetical protein